VIDLAEQIGQSVLVFVILDSDLPCMGTSLLTRNNSVKQGEAKMHRSQFVGILVVLKKGAVQE